jgi:hypothetical protein
LVVDGEQLGKFLIVGTALVLERPGRSSGWAVTL